MCRHTAVGDETRRFGLAHGVRTADTEANTIHRFTLDFVDVALSVHQVDQLLVLLRNPLPPPRFLLGHKEFIPRRRAFLMMVINHTFSKIAWTVLRCGRTNRVTMFFRGRMMILDSAPTRT